MSPSFLFVCLSSLLYHYLQLWFVPCSTVLGILGVPACQPMFITPINEKSVTHEAPSEDCWGRSPGCSPSLPLSVLEQETLSKPSHQTQAVGTLLGNGT